MKEEGEKKGVKEGRSEGKKGRWRNKDGVDRSKQGE
jgi:hypothetical protein